LAAAALARVPSAMGCCCSGHSEAKETNLPPPQFGKDIKVLLKRQGWLGLDADFDVKDEENCNEKGEPGIWLLMDAVGGIFDSYFDYYLKYRATGMEESIILGCCNMKKDYDYMWNKVTYAHQHYGRRFPTYNERNRRWVDKAVSAKWIIIRRARLFDGTPGPNGEKQHKLVGWMQIAGMGTYHRHYHRETWEERRTRKDKDGNEEEYWTTCTDGFDRSDTDVKDFRYKMKSYMTEFNIQFDSESSGSWLTSDKLIFLATRAGDGMPLFKVTSNGKSEAQLQTFSQSDPVSALLAAFGVSLKMEPKEYQRVCSGYCHSHISLDSHPGQFGGFGPTDAEFEQMCPTPNLGQPAAGFSYGVTAEAIPMAMPVVTAVPFTPIPTATPVFAAIPVAVPLQTPPIGVETAYDPIPMATPVVAQLAPNLQSEVVTGETIDVQGAVPYQPPMAQPYQPGAVAVAQPVYA